MLISSIPPLGRESWCKSIVTDTNSARPNIQIIISTAGHLLDLRLDQLTAM